MEIFTIPTQTIETGWVDIEAKSITDALNLYADIGEDAALDYGDNYDRTTGIDHEALSTQYGVITGGNGDVNEDE